MNAKNPVCLSLCAAALLIASSSAPAAQIIIVQDTFSGGNGDTLAGRTPDTVDLPGTTYTISTNSTCCGYPQPSIDTSAGKPAPSAGTGFNGSAYINIGSVAPPLIQISADVQINTIITNDAASYARGVGLGFFTGADNTSEASSTFTGLDVKPDGTLSLVAGGVASTTYSVAPFTGFSPTAFYNLSYDVDTATGVISHVIFNGHDDTAALAGGTSSSLTPGFLVTGGNLYAGFYGSTSANPSFFGRVDNFTISSPEPSSLILCGLGAAALFAAVRRRRKA